MSATGIEPVLVATAIAFAGGMRFSAEVEGNPPAEDQDLVVDVGVFVEATAQGACNAAKGEPEDVE